LGPVQSPLSRHLDISIDRARSEGFLGRPRHRPSHRCVRPRPPANTYADRRTGRGRLLRLESLPHLPRGTLPSHALSACWRSPQCVLPHRSPHDCLALHSRSRPGSEGTCHSHASSPIT
jgi:hypothetical protein